MNVSFTPERVDQGDRDSVVIQRWARIWSSFSFWCIWILSDGYQRRQKPSINPQRMLASQVLHSITINISYPTVDMDNLLQCLATSPCTSATTYATHELTIKSLSPTCYNRAFERIIMRDELQTLHTHTPPEALLVMKKVLFDALSSFQNVQSVSYVFHPVYSLFAPFKILFGTVIVDGNLVQTTELGLRPLSWMPWKPLTK